MALGRGFSPGEERVPVVVLGYNLWQGRFAADPSITGKTVMPSGRPFQVVGVAPPAFHGLDQILYTSSGFPSTTPTNSCPTPPTSHPATSIGCLSPDA